MQFNSIDFMMFFPVVLIFYFVIPKKMRGIGLLIASYYFYISWNVWYVILIASSTIVTYISGLIMESKSYRKKKITMFTCIIINLGILAVFKYGNFIIGSLSSVLNVFHISVIERRLDFLLPVGISFYTFQALGYVIDIYRGDIKAEKSFIRYALFVSFFPQLVAGPIERSKNLLSQIDGIEDIKLWNAKRVTSGAILMVWGFFMKMVIADRVSLLVNTVFNNYRMYGSSELILAAIGFAIQIYCDFGSYSIIAIGSAKILGFELMENFNTPYFAKSIKEFWNRWHISLSTWFKDYLYIPLGGNRRGRIRKLVNIMLVFLVSGLWHGADWSFVVWGGVHGFYLALGDVLKPFRTELKEKLKIKIDCLSWKLLQVANTFLLIVFAWIFFRADTVDDAFHIIRRIITRPTPWLLLNGGIYNLGLDRVEMNILVFSIIVLFMVDLVRYLKNQTLDAFLFEQNVGFEWLIVIAMIVMIFIFGEYGPNFDAQQFIYFQF